MNHLRSTEMSEEVEEKSDFDYSQEVIRRMIEKSEEALDGLADFAKDAEHPRAYEVLYGMIKATSDMAKELAKNSRENEKMNDESTKNLANSTGEGDTQNNFFIGDTADLQRMIEIAAKSSKKEVLIKE